MNTKCVVEKCANCLLHGWKQLEDLTKLQQCGKCKVIRYCSLECQVEHWEKVHKRQCSFFKDPAKSLRLRHKEDECVICQKVAEVGQYKIREPKNPNYDCIHRMVQEIIPSEFPSHPWRITGEPEDTREKAIVIMCQLLLKLKITQPNAAFTCREELKKFFASLFLFRFEIWRDRITYPQPEAIQKMVLTPDLEKQYETIQDKLELLKFSGVMTDPFLLWDTVKFVKCIALDLDLVMILKFLKDPLSNLPDDIKKLVSEGLSNVDKYLTEANKVLEALDAQVIPYQDILKIILGGNLKLNCSFCSEEMNVSNKNMLFEPGSYCRLLLFETYSCGRDDCQEKMKQRIIQGRQGQAAIEALWQEREVNSCDFCFQRIPVRLQNVESKVHRCSKCLTVMYCSLDCRDQDREVHIKICKEDQDGRKKKLGVSARMEAVRDEVNRWEQLPITRSEPEIAQVFEKFKKKNKRTSKK